MDNRHLYPRPNYSPWGEIYTCRKLAPGVFSVSTPGHGGLMIHPDVAEQVLSPRARRRASPYHSWLCYEENCQYAIALYEQPTWGGHSEAWLRAFPTAESCREGMRKVIEGWDPEYFANEEDRDGRTPGGEKK